MLKYTGLTMFVALWLSLAGSAQPPTLSLGNTDLTLGMSKEAVQKTLQNYTWIRDLGGAQLISALSHILDTEQKKGHAQVTIDITRKLGPPGRSNMVDLILSDLNKAGDPPVRKVVQLFVTEDGRDGVLYGLVEILEQVRKPRVTRLESPPPDSKRDGSK